MRRRFMEWPSNSMDLICADRPLIIHHGPCPDGFMSAKVAWDHFRTYNGDDCVDIHSAAYKTEPPEVKGRDVYILDFCYPASAMLTILGDARRVTVIEHHKDKGDVLAEVDYFASKAGYGEKFIWNFDTSHSGARLTWEYFNGDLVTRRHPGAPSKVPAMVDYVEDRDLWAWKLPHSREVNACIRTLPWSLNEWDAFDYGLECQVMFGRGKLLESADVVKVGGKLLKLENELIDAMASHSHMAEIAGYLVPIVNCSCLPLVSELAGRMSHGHPFAASWFYRPDGNVQVSLRSSNEQVDCGVIAKLFGGGGHPHAAGFEVSTNDHPLLDLPIWKTLSQNATIGSA